MVRPCFLMIDREFPGSISTRKLVMETAKYNVITAYSGLEALETFELFPSVSAIVLNADIRDIPCSELVTRMKSIRQNVPIIVIMGPHPHPCEGTDYQLASFEPKVLLALLQKLTPAETAGLQAHEIMLEAETPGM